MLVCIALSSCSSPAQSNDAASEDLEAQVLQIIRNNPEVILESVQAYQQQQQETAQEARRAVVAEMASDPASVIGDSPVKGAESREIVMVEFSDFQCPFCAKAHDTVKAFMEKNGDRVTLVYKHLPLVSIHPQALPAAQAAWAAQQQGQFWAYYDALFENQDRLGDDLYVEIATDLGLDLEQFDRDRNSDESLQAVQADLELADELGLNGTPAFFINGEGLSGAVELAEFEAVLERVTAARQ
ncbi:disulfide bond formation protein DsbA [Leptolyngbya valderiana BDU 20041]|nr:thioredoxin domain-containing protein [Geitlerinema sp. CS-897]OAB61890.1 disulfide bond formation protein DsbA [Leptolyngbya valderiana BDU 20041]PPT06526.1 DSBA oxidoreductase [Geitlerinema sp. FC II]